MNMNTLDTEYDKFIEQKTRRAQSHGFDPLPITAPLFDWQAHVVRWAVKQGRCALFEDCGLGKTAQQLEWAWQVCQHTGGAVLILTPLAVAHQTVKEAEKFGIVAKVAKTQDDITESGIYITNYEKLDHFDCQSFQGVVLDESSILKNFTGIIRRKLTESFSNTPHRLCCTATPAPNDFMEFGQHCEFLGVMPSNEMLSRWFINDTMNFGTYRLKGHAETDFWHWVASWAACLSSPDDIGYDGSKYVLPKLNIDSITVSVDESAGADEGELFRNPELNATSIHREMRISCPERCKQAAQLVASNDQPWIVWCNTNYEADELAKLIPDAIEVRGSDSAKDKERKLDEFSDGKARVIITKAGVAGYGLNWQHCANVVFVGLNYSFEDFYQALRRSYRFGQTKPVNAYIIQGSTEGAILSVVQRKIDQHKDMQEKMKIAAKAFRNETDKTLIMKDDITIQQGDGWTAAHADCVRFAKTLPDNSVDFSVYSPPFASLYIYSADSQDMGNCANDEEFMEHYKFLIAEKLRITKPGCLSAVHCKNLVNYANRDGMAGMRDFRGEIIKAHVELGWAYHAEVTIWKDPVIEMQRTKAQGLLYKQLRQNSKYTRTGMAEYLMIFRKWGDPDEMKENPVTHTHESFPLDQWQQWASPVWMDIKQTRVLNVRAARCPTDEKHLCPLQLDVIERAVTLWSNEGDLVYSPFTGIGSEGVGALSLNRKFIGSELKESYFRQACENLRNAKAQLTLF
jgi:DNA modification methylase